MFKIKFFLITELILMGLSTLGYYLQGSDNFFDKLLGACRGFMGDFGSCAYTYGRGLSFIAQILIVVYLVIFIVYSLVNKVKNNAKS